MLLAITGLALGATTRGTLALADDSELVTKAQSLTTTRVEDALSGNCVASANGFDTRPRMNVLWVQTAGSRQTQTHLDVTLSRSPIAAIGHTTVQMAIESGGVCP